MDPGWYADPFGRHEHRWHDGTTWTEHVSSGGEAATDPPVPVAPEAGALAIPAPPPAPTTIQTPQVAVVVPSTVAVASSSVQTTVRIHTHRSVFWWFFIGWWYVPIKWIIGFPIVIARRLTGRRPGDIKVKIDSQHETRGQSGPG